MWDLYLAVAMILLLSAAAFAWGRRLAHGTCRRALTCLLVLSCLVLLVYVSWIWDKTLLARLLPFSGLIVLGNWFPILAAFQAGLMSSRPNCSAARRLVLVLPLLCVGVYSLAVPLIGRAPRCTEEWDNGICLQTTRYTCAPACAATVLRQHQIPATESEMARLCLTRRGTMWQGLYRGLKQKTAGTRWDVEVFACGAEDLRSKVDGPVIVQVQLDEDALDRNGYLREAGWIPGQPHSTVIDSFFGPGYVGVSDPAAGRETWTERELATLYRGVGIRLVERAPATGMALIQAATPQR